MNTDVISTRKFTFTDVQQSEQEVSSKSNESLLIVISETIEAEYGSYVWPCSLVMSQFIWFHRKSLFCGKTILEIGAGTALPSIVAVKCGKPNRVVITDKKIKLRSSLAMNGIEIADSLAMTPTSCDRCPVHLLNLKWGEATPGLESILPDIILGSDCFYSPSIFEDVISTVYFLLKTHNKSSKTPGKFYCTYQTRSLDWSINDVLNGWDLCGYNIPLETFNADRHRIGESNLPGYHDIQMIEIYMKIT